MHEVEVPCKDIHWHRVTSQGETTDSQQSIFKLYSWLLGVPESSSSPAPSTATHKQSPGVHGLSSSHCASSCSRASNLGEAKQGLDPNLLQKLEVISKKKELLWQLGGNPKTE